MQDLGYSDYHWETSIQLTPQVVDDGTWDTVLLAPLRQSYFLEQEVVAAHGMAMDSRMNNIETDEREEADGLACREKHPTPSEASVDSFANPAGLEDLHREWEQATQVLTERVGNLDTYKACLMRRDIPGDPAKYKGDPVAAFKAELRERLPTWKVIVDPQKRVASEAWRTAVAAEDAYLEADAACRKPVFEEQLPELAVIADAFTVEHDAEIDRLALNWADVKSRASELGWSPDAPLGNWSDPLINDPLRGVDESN